MAEQSDLERERNAIVHSIISLENQLIRGRVASKDEYLRQRQELEQRLLQVMDELTRRRAFPG